MDLIQHFDYANFGNTFCSDITMDFLEKIRLRYWNVAKNEPSNIVRIEDKKITFEVNTDDPERYLDMLQGEIYDLIALYNYPANGARAYFSETMNLLHELRPRYENIRLQEQKKGLKKAS